MNVNEAEADFLAAIDDAIDEAMAKEVCAEFICTTLEARGASVATAKLGKICDILIKMWVVAVCSLTPVLIQAVRFHADYTGHKLTGNNSEVLNWVMLVCLLAVVAQFFDFKGAMPVIDRLIRFWRTGK